MTLKNFWMMIGLLVATTLFSSASASAADRCDQYREAEGDLYLHCRHILAAETIEGEVTDLNEAIGILADQDGELEERVAALEQQPERSTLGSPRAQVPTASSYYEVGMPGLNAAARSCSMLSGIDTKVEVADLADGREKYVSKTPVPTKVLVLKDGEPLAIRTASGFEPFYADLDRDGQADPEAYMGVAASGNVCLAIEPGGSFEVLYLTRSGQVIVDGVPVDKWTPVARVYYRLSGNVGTHRVWGWSGLRSPL